MADLTLARAGNDHRQQTGCERDGSGLQPHMLTPATPANRRRSVIKGATSACVCLTARPSFSERQRSMEQAVRLLAVREQRVPGRFRSDAHKGFEQPMTGFARALPVQATSVRTRRTLRLATRAGFSFRSNKKGSGIRRLAIAKLSASLPRCMHPGEHIDVEKNAGRRQPSGRDPRRRR